MNKLTKVLLIAITLAFLPITLKAQTPYRQYASNGILLNFHEIDDVYFRTFLLYSLSQEHQFILTADDEPGLFSISYDDESGFTSLNEAFETFYHNTYADFSLLTKEDISHRLPDWKSCIVPSHFVSMMMDVSLRDGRPSNNHCVDSDPFCTSDVITFAAASSSSQAESGANYGCLSATYNPSWYHMRINTPGQFVIHMEGRDPTTNAIRDIDFCMWGPFTNPTSPCVAQLTSNKIIDCSYSTSYMEDIFLGYQLSEHDHGGSTLADGTINYHMPETGEYYILLITNYSQQPCTISFTKAEGSGPGTTDCGILPGVVSNDGPYCVGETINLTVNQQDGATYSWTGPNGFTSSQLSPSRPNCTMAMAGTYTCVTTVGNQTTSASTEVVVYAQPTADFNATTVCEGNPTQFTSTSTTNPSGQPITHYHWNFGDDQIDESENPSHTYANPGTYFATLIISTGDGHCMSTITKPVTVEASPIANFNATTVCQGEATQFNSTSTGNNITAYQWNFGDSHTGTGQNPTHTYNQPGTYQVTLTIEGSGGICSDNITQTVTVNPSPTASFNATTVCQGEATQFTNTSTGQGISNYQWNFGDGHTGSGQSATHTYNQSGTYQATLTVQTPEGCSDAVTQTVTVNPVPTASFNATTVCQGEATQFTSTSTGQGINSYQWNFGDGQTNTGQNVSHTFAQAGSHQVTLTVQTASGCSDVITQTVNVNATPTATATALPATVIYGGNSSLSGNAGAQGVFNFHWEPANMVINPNSQTTQTVALQQSQTFTLTVTNPQGGCSSTAQVTVSLEGSSLTATATADNNELCEGETTVLHATPVAGTGNYTYSWTPANTLSNPNSQNPEATPGLGANTYTCHISDGFTSIDVSVTIQVHPLEEEHQYETICANDTYNFYGNDFSTPNTYEHHELTDHGCDKTILLHLDNWPIYDETTITEYICQGESYEFYGNTYTQSIQTAYTDHTTQHGCDSIVRLNLTVYPANDTIPIDPSICVGQSYNFHGTNYNQDGQIAYFDTIDNHGCLLVEKLMLTVGEYQMPPIEYQYECYPHGTTPSWTWDKNGVTYHTDAIDEIVQEDPEGGCDIKYRLNLKFHEEYYHEETKVACDAYTWPINGVTYEESQEEVVEIFHYDFGSTQCDSIYVLHLEINSFETNEIEINTCDSYQWVSETIQQSGDYEKTFQNQMGCDSIVTLHLGLEYTPRPTPIYPTDINNTAPHWVITATEFQINSYEFNLWDSLHPAADHWTSVEWNFVKRADNGNGWEADPDVQWILAPDSTTTPAGMQCKMYVLNYEPDTTWLEAKVHNSCTEEGIARYYWFVSSFYGIEEPTTLHPVDFTVVPNPNKGQMELCFEHFSGDINIKVYDMRGALIDQFETVANAVANKHTYQMRNRDAGIYFIVATGREGTIAKKVIILR